MTAERPIRTRRVYQGRVVALRVDEVVLPSGRVTEREVVEHRGAVGIIPVTAQGDVLLVRQFRAAIGRELLEIPAGTVEPGEGLEACVQRELAEEVGMRAGHLEPLLSFFPSPGFLTEEVHLYLASDLSPHRLRGEEEDLTVVRVSLQDARALVSTGEIVDGKSIIGIILAEERIGRAT